MADQQMDSILAQLSKLGLGAPVEVCKHFTTAIRIGNGGKTAIVVATFMAFITADDVLESVDQGEDFHDRWHDFEANEGKNWKMGKFAKGFRTHHIKWNQN